METYVPQRWLFSEEALGLREYRRLLLLRFGLFFGTQVGYDEEGGIVWVKLLYVVWQGEKKTFAWFSSLSFFFADPRTRLPGQRKKLAPASDFAYSLPPPTELPATLEFAEAGLWMAIFRTLWNAQ